MPVLVSVAIVVILLLASAIRILREYERGVIFRLGRLVGAKGPGLIILIPFIDKMVKTSLRTVVMDVPSTGSNNYRGLRYKRLPPTERYESLLKIRRSDQYIFPWLAIAPRWRDPHSFKHAI